MEVPRRARNGTLKQVLSVTGGAHMTGLKIDKIQPKRMYSLGCSLYSVPFPSLPHNYFLLSSLLSGHLNTSRITNFILDSEHEQTSSAGKRESALAGFSSITWAASPATIQDALNSCLGLRIREEKNPLAGSGHHSRTANSSSTLAFIFCPS